MVRGLSAFGTYPGVVGTITALEAHPAFAEPGPDLRMEERALWSQAAQQELMRRPPSSSKVLPLFLLRRIIARLGQTSFGGVASERADLAKA